MENLFKKLIAGVMVTALLITSFILPTSAAEINSEDNNDESVGHINGADNRVRSYDPRIVRVETSNAYGTGFLIDKNIIVTAAHCVDSNTICKVKTIQNQSYDVSVIAIGKYNGIDVSDDWAILKANTTISNDYFEFSTSVSNNDYLTTTGFPSDKGYQVTQSGKNMLHHIGSDYINHDFDIIPGASGSPIYKTINGIDYVVAIVCASGVFCGVELEAANRIDEEYNQFAGYRDNYYTVKYYPNGATGSMSDSKIIIGNGNNLRKNAFKNTGYKFKGWFAYRRSDNKWLYEKISNSEITEWKTKGDYPGWTQSLYNDCQFIANSTSVKKDTVEMYAQWDRIKYTIEYWEGAKDVTGEMDDTIVTYGISTKLRPNAYKRDGYAFIGWVARRFDINKNAFLYLYSNSNGESHWYIEGKEPSGYTKSIYKDQAPVAKSTDIDGDTVMFEAQWAPKYTVKYNANGGTGTMQDTTVVYGYDTPLRKNTFTKKNYEFIGWKASREINKTTQYLYNTGSKKEWHTANEAKNKNWTYALYPDCQKIAKSINVPNGIINMTAQWKEKQYYTVTYSAGGGSGTMADTKVYYGDPTPLRKNTFTYNGYVFVGWKASRKIDGKTQYWYNTGWHTKTEYLYAKCDGDIWYFDLYPDCQKIAKSIDVPNGKVTMTAQWKKI